MSPRQRIIYVECPACRWPKAVLAYEKPRKRCFLCPRCQHLWDTAETADEEYARLKHRQRALREEHEVLRMKPFDQAEHTEHKDRLRKHLEDLRSRRRRGVQKS
jgi:hypothetical protein